LLEAKGGGEEERGSNGREGRAHGVFGSYPRWILLVAKSF
jgi:hypothetical protein